MSQDFRQGVGFSHQLFKEHIKKGAIVIDATAGNGHDTLFLAKLVGPEGQVLAFDIQERAIRRTEVLLEKEGISDRVRLIQDGHENLGDYLNTSVDGILFNLGYLPGGDKEIITRPETTLKAVKSGLRLLKPGGLMALVIYSGHPGGREEKEALLKYAVSLDYQEYNVLHYHFVNQFKAPSEVLAIKKRSNLR
ncbi:MAG: hypothetical protein PWR10_213 [Halanaerobiales bacterium]|nr:hypothetical protein [Halanaerobiales bacterium]